MAHFTKLVVMNFIMEIELEMVVQKSLVDAMPARDKNSWYTGTALEDESHYRLICSQSLKNTDFLVIAERLSYIQGFFIVTLSPLMLRAYHFIWLIFGAVLQRCEKNQETCCMCVSCRLD